jgi:hypothetical protein
MSNSCLDRFMPPEIINMKQNAMTPVPARIQTHILRKLEHQRISFCGDG